MFGVDRVLLRFVPNEVHLAGHCEVSSRCASCEVLLVVVVDAGLASIVGMLVQLHHVLLMESVVEMIELLGVVKHGLPLLRVDVSQE